MEEAAAIAMSVVGYKTRLQFERMRDKGQGLPAAADVAEAPAASHAPGGT